MLDGPPSQSDCDHWRAGCGESSHAPFGNRPTEKDPNQGHLAGGRVHAEGGPGKRAGHKASTAPRSDPYSTGESSQQFAEAGAAVRRDVARDE
jgi:hypothetical protein